MDVYLKVILAVALIGIALVVIFIFLREWKQVKEWRKIDWHEEAKRHMSIMSDLRSATTGVRSISEKDILWWTKALPVSILKFQDGSMHLSAGFAGQSQKVGEAT